MPGAANDLRMDELIEKILTGTEFVWLSDVVTGVEWDKDLKLENVLKKLKNDIPKELSVDDRYLILNDIDEWEKHWKRYKSTTPLEKRTLNSFLYKIGTGQTQNTEKGTGVALLTAHMSTGLEFEVVFVIGLTEGTFPDYRAVRSGDAAIAHEKDNLCAAITCAKRLCYLSYPRSRMTPWNEVKPQQPSRFIAEVCKPVVHLRPGSQK
jgi:DNA helicase-2/ATP-dependent DNA helicase PcrA